jgi:hypothetical protein
VPDRMGAGVSSRRCSIQGRADGPSLPSGGAGGASGRQPVLRCLPASDQLETHQWPGGVVATVYCGVSPQRLVDDERHKQRGGQWG